MIRTWRALAAILLAAAPAAAQVRAVAPVIAPVAAAAPAAAAAVSVSAAPSLAAAPLAAPSAPALAAAPVPSLPAPAFSAPAAAPAPAAALAAAPAPALAAPGSAALLPAAADGVRRSRELAGGAAYADAPSVAFGHKMFDGAGELVTRSGSVFVPSLAPRHAVRGGIALVRVKAAPAAPVLRGVPDTQGLSGAALLERVSQIAARGQTEHGYKEASRYLFSTADNHTLNGVAGVADAYSGIFVPGTSADGHDYPENGDEDGDGYSRHQGMNVEHTFPQSLFKQDLPMRSDLHHLMATFEHPNGMRGSLPFGVVTGPTDYHNNAGAKRDATHFEPPDFTKGRVARGLLYFYARYKGMPFFAGRAASFWNGQIETLLDWNRRFPPTVEEVRRNDHVEAFQGNRNPFVDDPGLADRIGADALRAGGARRVALASPRGLVASLGDEAPRRGDKPRKGNRRGSFKRGRGSRSGRR